MPFTLVLEVRDYFFYIFAQCLSESGHIRDNLTYS